MAVVAVEEEVVAVVAVVEAEMAEMAEMAETGAAPVLLSPVRPSRCLKRIPA